MKMYGRRAHEKSCCRWCHPWGARDKGQIKGDEERAWRREADEEMECGFCAGRTKIPEPWTCSTCYSRAEESHSFCDPDCPSRPDDSGSSSDN